VEEGKWGRGESGRVGERRGGGGVEWCRKKRGEKERGGGREEMGETGGGEERG